MAFCNPTSAMKNMLLVFVVVGVATGAGAAAVDTDRLTSGDSTNDTDKDMYVVHAVVYEVGIMTNSSDDDLSDRYNHTGSQESLTLYRGGGGGDSGAGGLRGLPAPLLTNVTSQSYVGVAPAPHTSGARAPITLGGGWSERPVGEADINRKPITRRQIDDEDEPTPSEEDLPTSDDAYWWGLARSRRALAPAAGAAPVPTLALPSALLALDGSLADIPVPVPSTALVNYSRVNAVIVPANVTT